MPSKFLFTGAINTVPRNVTMFHKRFCLTKPRLLSRLLSSEKVSGVIDFESVSRLSKIDTRSLIGLKGERTASVINNLTTNDYLEYMKNSGMFTAFLNPKGRTICEAIIYNIPKVKDSRGCEEYNVIIETSSNAVDCLISHLKKYSIRTGVEIERVDNASVYQLYGKGVSEDFIYKSSVISTIADLRAPNLGFRILCDNNLSLSRVIKEKKVELSNPNLYKALRISMGVPEGPGSISINKSFPLESNFDLINAISWNKGCYLGQELTFMTHSRGAVRKRLLPVQLYKAGTIEPDKLYIDKSFCTPKIGEQESIVNKIDSQNNSGDIKHEVALSKKQASSKMLIEGVYNIALAMVRLDELEYCSKNKTYAQKHVWVLNSDPNICLKVFVPSWFPAI